jgi:hypothetical protein
MKRWILILLVFIPFHGLAQFSAINWNDCPLNDIAHTKIALTWNGASNGEKITTLYSNRNHDTIVSIAFYEVEDTADRFAINSDSVYWTDVNAVQSSKIYKYRFRVVDGFISDTADLYIYIAPSDSCIQWNDHYKDDFDEGYYYYINRNDTVYADAPIYINADKVTIFSKGGGKDGVILSDFDSDPSPSYERALITPYSDDIKLFDIVLNRNADQYCNYGIFQETYSQSNIYNNVTITATEDNKWYNCIRRTGTVDYQTNNNKWYDCKLYYADYDGAYIEFINDHEVISCDFKQMGCDDSGEGDPCECDIINYITETRADLRYNNFNHSEYPSKHAVILAYETDNYMTYDTLMHNHYRGPGRLHGDLGYPFNAISSQGASGLYIAYERIDSTEIGLYIYENHAKHIKVENCLFKGCRLSAIEAFFTIDSSKFINNTFTDPARDGTYEVFSGDGWTTKDTSANNIIYIQDGQLMCDNDFWNVKRFNNIIYDTTGSHYKGHEGTNEIFINPLLNADLTLQEGSPAINAAWDHWGMVYDFAGNVRDELPDIGAYEYQEEETGIRNVNYRNISLDNASHKGMPSQRIVKYREIIYSSTIEE